MKQLKTIFFVMLCLVIELALFACSSSHKVSLSWKVDAENHWHECADCDELFDLGKHDMVITSSNEVSCAEDGYTVYTCSVCGYSHKDVIDATGHEMQKHNAVSGDCTSAGAMEYYSCNKCNKYFSDIQGKNEIGENGWVIACAGHTLTHVEAKEPTNLENGQKEHYYCSVCDKYFEDEKCTKEITDGIMINQLVISVSEAKEMPVGSKVIVRGVVTGVVTTQSSINIVNAITFKDENNNTCMALSGGKPDASSLASSMGTAADMIIPFEKGTILEIPVTVTKSNITYASGNGGIIYLLYTDTGEELSVYNKGTGDYKFNLLDENITNISSQEDFFKLLGLANGSNVFESEGFEYSYEVAGSNAYKLVKMSNLRAILGTDSGYENTNKHHWRPCFSESCTTWASTSISNSANKTNKIGAKQTFYPSFYNYNTFTNTGKTFSELLFGDTSSVTPKEWKNHLTFNGDVYAMFIGGSDYYAQFVVLDSDWVIPAV